MLSFIEHHLISTLFPYTTLFRSRDLRRQAALFANANGLLDAIEHVPGFFTHVGNVDAAHTADNLGDLDDFLGGRSEEHTSELQSHHDLVCRLLLEKKKTRHSGAS